MVFFNNKIKVVRHTIVFFKYLKTFLIIFIFLSLDNNQILSLFLQYSRVDAFLFYKNSPLEFGFN